MTIEINWADIANEVEKGMGFANREYHTRYVWPGSDGRIWGGPKSQVPENPEWLIMIDPSQVPEKTKPKGESNAQTDK